MMPPVSSKTALFLDIDGTLLDVARTPDRVKVPSELVFTLEKLAHRLDGALAFVSGRSLESIDALFAPFRPAAIGAHGGQIRDIRGEVSSLPQLSRSVFAIFENLARTVPGLLLENKKCAIALHYRLAPEAKPVLSAQMQKHAELFRQEGIEILEGKLVLEARYAGVDKGGAVSELSRQFPFKGRQILFGGDDTTDLDVFRILPELGGSGFSVGKRFSGAQYYFERPQNVRQWLMREAHSKAWR